jgi:hypothetical protein
MIAPDESFSPDPTVLDLFPSVLMYSPDWLQAARAGKRRLMAKREIRLGIGFDRIMNESGTVY